MEINKQIPFANFDQHCDQVFCVNYHWPMLEMTILRKFHVCRKKCEAEGLYLQNMNWWRRFCVRFWIKQYPPNEGEVSMIGANFLRNFPKFPPISAFRFPPRYIGTLFASMVILFLVSSRTFGGQRSEKFDASFKSLVCREPAF